MINGLIEYEASKTCSKFHRDDNFVRGLVGPIGSGKSVACCWEIFRRAHEQQPAEDGIRYSRWLVVRNTYRELQDTTLKTWFDWFDPEMGVGNWVAGDMTHIISGDGIHMEVLFRALDRPDDIKKLLSLELTGAWLNEAREIPKAVLDMLQGRVGRYPSMRIGGASWIGIIGDTNPPDSDHWWYRLFEEERPDGWSIYHQPGGLDEDAENLENLPAGYYQRLMQGHDQAWIDVYVHGKYGYVQEGKPIYPEYNDHIHSTLEPIARVAGTIYVGIDFGLTPAAVFGQLTKGGQWQILDELVTEDMGSVNFAKLLSRKLRDDFAGATLRIFGDPAGEQRSQVDERTPFKVLNAAGIPASKAPTNDFTIRREAAVAPMMRLTMSGQPGFVLGPNCKTLRKACAGGYKYRRLQVGGEERYQDEPDKNQYSHVAEALQYMMVGAGEGRQVIKSAGLNTKPKINRTIRNRRRAG